MLKISLLSWPTSSIGLPISVTNSICHTEQMAAVCLAFSPVLLHTHYAIHLQLYDFQSSILKNNALSYSALPHNRTLVNKCKMKEHRKILICIYAIVIKLADKIFQWVKI